MRPTVTGIERVLADAGGADAPQGRGGQLRTLLGRWPPGRARRGAALGLRASGRRRKAASTPSGLVVVAPIPGELRASPGRRRARWLLAATPLVEALEESVSVSGELRRQRLRLPRAPSARAGRRCRRRELALAFERAGRARRPAEGDRDSPCPRRMLEEVVDLKAPIGRAHPLRVALEIARLGGWPNDQSAHTRARGRDHRRPGRRTRRHPVPHDDPIPHAAWRDGSSSGSTGWAEGRLTHRLHPPRARLRQRRPCAGRGRWEAVLLSGLLAEKPSVGQRRLPEPAAGCRYPRAHRAGDVPDDLTTLNAKRHAVSPRGDPLVPYSHAMSQVQHPRPGQQPRAQAGEESSPTPASARCGPTSSSTAATTMLRAGGRRRRRLSDVCGAPPDSSADRRTGVADLRRGPPAHQRVGPRVGDLEHRRGRPRRDPLPQPPRLRSPPRSRAQARRPRAATSTRCSRGAAAHRRRRAPGAARRSSTTRSSPRCSRRRGKRRKRFVGLGTTAGARRPAARGR